MRDKIQRCRVILCLISGATHTSSWVMWEPETAIGMDKLSIAMAVKGANKVTLPAPIRDKGVPFYAWNPSRLKVYLADAVIVG